MKSSRPPNELATSVTQFGKKPTVPWSLDRVKPIFLHVTFFDMALTMNKNLISLRCVPQATVSKICEIHPSPHRNQGVSKPGRGIAVYCGSVCVRHPTAEDWQWQAIHPPAAYGLSCACWVISSWRARPPGTGSRCRQRRCGLSISPEGDRRVLYFRHREGSVEFSRVSDITGREAY